MVRPKPVTVLEHGCRLPPAQWVHPDAPSRFAALTETSVRTTTSARWLTFDGLAAKALRWCVLTPMATGRHLDVAALLRCLDHMVAAHVLVYAVIKDRQPDALVGLTTAATGVYELDRLALDVLAGRSERVERFELTAWIAARRAAFDAATPAPLGLLGRATRAWSAAAIAGERALPTAVTAVYASVHVRPVDDLDA